MPDLTGVTVEEILAQENDVQLLVRVICYGCWHADIEFVVVVSSPDGVRESVYKHGKPGYAQACEAYEKELGRL